MDMPLEDIVHIEDISRTTLVATILEVVAGRLDRLGFGSMRLQMAIVKYTSDTGGLAGLDHEAPVPNIGCEDEVLTVAPLTLGAYLGDASNPTAKTGVS